MIKRNSVRAAVLMTAIFAGSSAAQSSPVPIRPLSAPTATLATPLRSVSELREMASGKVLVNSSGEHQLLLFDAKLANPVIVADTLGTAAPYPRFGKLIAYTGDSTLFAESDTRTFSLIDPAGAIKRVVAPPTDDFNGVTSGGPVGIDARGGLIVQTQRMFVRPSVCQADGSAGPARPAPSDSVTIMRGDFERRQMDSVVKVKIAVAGFLAPMTTYDASCRAISAKLRVNPAIPASDAWTVTSTGAIAIVRGHDYHVDWVDRDGTKRSGPRLPFDWRRITDADKQARVDSARHIADSLTAAGGYRMQSCNSGRSMSFNVSPPRSNPSSGSGSGGNPGGGSSGGSGGGGGVGSASVSVGRGGSGGGGGGGDGPPANNDCQTVTVAVEFAPFSEMADYIPPIRDNVVKADRVGNIWILPSTSTLAKGGLLYDVVNPKGELVERVQLPADRTIAGFGRGGVVFLSHQMSPTATVLERVTIVRK